MFSSKVAWFAAFNWTLLMKLEPFLGLRCSKSHPRAHHPPGCSGDNSALGQHPQFLLWLVLGALWCVGLGAPGFGGSWCGPEAVWAVLPQFCTRVVSFLFLSQLWVQLAPCVLSSAGVLLCSPPGVTAAANGEILNLSQNLCTREECGHPRGARHGEGSSRGAALGWGFPAAVPTSLPPAL